MKAEHLDLASKLVGALKVATGLREAGAIGLLYKPKSGNQDYLMLNEEERGEVQRIFDRIVENKIAATRRRAAQIGLEL